MFSVHISSYGFTRETDWRARKKRKSNSRLCLKQFLLGNLSTELRREGQRKRYLGLEFALFQTSSLQFYLVQYVKYGRIFLELILNDFIQDQKQRKGKSLSCVHVLSRRSRARTAKKCTKKRDAPAKLLFCLNLNLLLFCRSRCRRRRRRCRCRGCLKLPIDPARRSQLKVTPPPPSRIFF